MRRTTLVSSTLVTLALAMIGATPAFSQTKITVYSAGPADLIDNLAS